MLLLQAPPLCFLIIVLDTKPKPQILRNILARCSTVYAERLASLVVNCRMRHTVSSELAILMVSIPES